MNDLIKLVQRKMQHTLKILEVQTLTLEELTDRMEQNQLTLGQWQFVTRAFKEMQQVQSDINFTQWMGKHD